MHKLPFDEVGTTDAQFDVVNIIHKDTVITLAYANVCRIPDNNNNWEIPGICISTPASEIILPNAKKLWTIESGKEGTLTRLRLTRNGLNA